MHFPAIEPLLGTTRGEVARFVWRYRRSSRRRREQNGLHTLEFILEMVPLNAEGLNRSDLGESTAATPSPAVWLKLVAQQGLHLFGLRFQGRAAQQFSQP